jgi:septum site-determining protein MinD
MTKRCDTTACKNSLRKIERTVRLYNNRCPAGIGEGLELAAADADMAIVITEPEVASVRDADALHRALKDQGISETYCVVNKVNGELMTSGAVPGISCISKGLRMEIVGMIQRDDNINISTNKGEPIVMKKGTYIEKNMAKIIERILE